MNPSIVLLAVLSVFVSCETLSADDSDRAAGTAELKIVSVSGDGERADPDAANWDIESLDTAKDTDYLSAVEKDVILEMNKVRADPGKYAELYIRPRLKYYSGRYYSVPGEITLLTLEGAVAVNSCISALRRMNAVGMLMPERGLSLAAEDHVNEQAETGRTGHSGADRSSPETRIKRYGAFGRSWSWGENIAYGDSSGREIVCSLLIDDGVPDRGHRANVMNKVFTQVGAAFGSHTQYGNSCTIDYATGYSSR